MFVFFRLRLFQYALFTPYGVIILVLACRLLGNKLPFIANETNGK